MRLHSRIGLVTNSSGEVFVMRKDQVPEDLDDLVRTLWPIWYSQASNWTKDYHKDLIERGFDPADLFRYSEFSCDDGAKWYREEAVHSFFECMRDYMGLRRTYGLPGVLDRESIVRVMAEHPDVMLFCEFYSEITDQFETERNATFSTEGENKPEFPGWYFDAYRYISKMAIKAGLYDEIEELAHTFSNVESSFGQWGYPSRNFEMAAAYKEAELRGEVDDHVFPASFVHYVCRTLGWFCYHNG